MYDVDAQIPYNEDDPFTEALLASCESKGVNIEEFCFKNDSNNPSVDFNYGEGCVGCPALITSVGYCITNEMDIEDLALYARDVLESSKLVHDFEAIDSQGHSMQCTHCGKVISISMADDWDQALIERCKGVKTNA